MEKFGHVEIKLENILSAKGISKNEICKSCNLQRTQLLRYCRNNVSRVDLEIIAKLCKRLDCTVLDILQYVPD